MMTVILNNNLSLRHQFHQTSALEVKYLLNYLIFLFLMHYQKFYSIIGETILVNLFIISSSGTIMGNDLTSFWLMPG